MKVNRSSFAIVCTMYTTTKVYTDKGVVCTLQIAFSMNYQKTDFPVSFIVMDPSYLPQSIITWAFVQSRANTPGLVSWHSSVGSP